MLNANISISREPVAELYSVTMMSQDGSEGHRQKATLGIHQLVPVLSALEIEAEAVESLYEMPVGASLRWNMVLSNRHGQQFTRALSLSSQVTTGRPCAA
jgi:hypothetical protein